MFYGVNENERRTQLRLFPSRRYTAAYYDETRVSLSLSLSTVGRLDIYLSKIRASDTLDESCSKGV